MCSLLVTGCGGGGSSGAPAPTPTPSNRAPQFTSGTGAAIVENSTSPVYLATASDPDGDPVSFSIVGGADAGFFRLSGNQLLFVSPPNFDAFADSDRDNVYVVTLSANDGRGGVASQTVNVTVTNSREEIVVTRIISGLGEVVGMAATGITARELVVGKRDGTFVRFEGSRSIGDAMPVSQNFFDGPAGGRVLIDIGWGTSSAPPVYRGLFGIVGSGSDIAMERAQQSGTFRGVMAYGNGLTANGKLFFDDRGEFLAALGDPNGPIAQLAFPPLENGFGKLFRMQPSGGASVNFLEATAIGQGIQSPGGFAMVSGQVALADQGALGEHEISLFGANQSPLNFGWPFLEGSVVRQTGAPSPLVGPSLVYPRSGTVRFEGQGIVMGAAYTGNIAGLVGQFVFGDRNGTIWTIPTATLAGGVLRGPRDMEWRNLDFAPDSGQIDEVVKIIVDPTGVLYILDSDGEVFRVDRAAG